MDHRLSRLLDLLPYMRLGPTPLLRKCSRAGLLMFIGFFIGRATREKTYIEKSADRVEQRRMQVIREIQQARSKASEQAGSDGRHDGNRGRFAITARAD